MRLRGALLWELDGEPRRDEVLISDERTNGANAHIEILDRGGQQQRATSPQELPAGSMLVLPDDVSDPDLDRIQGLGFDARRNSDAEAREFEERRAAIEAAHAELEEVTERLTRVLRQRHPQLFDSDGNMREDEYARIMLARTGGRKYLSREDIIALEEGRPLPPERSGPVDAP